MSVTVTVAVPAGNSQKARVASVDPGAPGVFEVLPGGTKVFTLDGADYISNIKLLPA